MKQLQFLTTSANNRKACSPLHLAVRYALLSLSLHTMGNIAVAEETAIELNQIDVTAPAASDTQPVKGYKAKKSSASTRTDTELRDTPQSISVVTQDIIQDQSIQSVSDAVRYVPGVTAVQGEGNRDALVFRGNATTGDLFVDGLRDDVQTFRDFYNTDRVEVLKGPNGMAFGRGGAGGAINRISKEAGWDPISQIIASYGAYNQKRISADFGQALTDDVAFRVNTVYENSDSYREGVNLERYGVTPTFTLKPTENTKVVLGFEYFKDKRTADRGQSAQATKTSPTAANPDFNRRPYDIGDHSTFFGNARLSPTETETVAFNALIEHAFDNGITLKNRTRYADYDKYYQNVFARTVVGTDNNLDIGAYRDNTQRENLINQTDLTYSLKTGAVEHKLLAGMEISKQKTDNQRFQQTSAEKIATVSASDPYVANATFNTLVRDQKSDVDVFAVYLQDQIIFSPKWQAIVGLRHDKFETDYTNKFTTPDQKIDTTDNLLSPRAGLIFKPVEAVSLYANYSLSYVPRAGDQLTSLTVANQSFDPEKFINYEVGAKWDINPNLAFTAAVYKLERENVQVTDPNNNSLQILVDGQETRGIELGVAGNITDKWSIFGGVAFQDGEITKQQGSGDSAILKGAELAQTPDRTLSLWNRYDINDIWAVALGVVSRSEMYAQSPTASQSTLLPGYTRYDAALFAKINKNTRFQLNLENITNKEYALYAHNNQNITPGSPVSARASLIYNF